MVQASIPISSDALRVMSRLLEVMAISVVLVVSLKTGSTPAGR